MKSIRAHILPAVVLLFLLACRTNHVIVGTADAHDGGGGRRVDGDPEAPVKPGDRGALAVFAGVLPSPDGVGLAARFSGPADVAVDGWGNVFVADSGNDTIRKITPDGVVTTFAGTARFSGTKDGTGPAARFDSPFSLAVDGGGNVFVADTDNDTIRKITPAGVVSTFAGTAGLPGSTDGMGADARFNSPRGMAVDGWGNVFVADYGNAAIRKITPDGIVTTLVQRSSYWVAVDGAGNVFFDGITKITPDGVVTHVVEAYYICGLAVDGAGDFLIANGRGCVIEKISPDGDYSLLAGSTCGGRVDGTGQDATFSSQLAGVALDRAGNLFVADVGNGAIRKVTPDGDVTTLAGMAEPARSAHETGADGTGADARFWFPTGVAADGAGNVFVADSDNHTIRRVTPDAVVTTLAGMASLPGAADGSGANARFRFPTGVAVDGVGNVFVADSGNETIRKVTPDGVVTTLAGMAGSAGSADGTGTDARFDSPYGVAVDRSGNVFVSDAGNHAVRKITPDAVVSTLAGDDARFNGHQAIAVDEAGNVIVADSGNHTVRKISPDGVVSTLAGTAGSWGRADGMGTDARFNYPWGVAVDGTGNVFVADSGNSSIRKITPSGAVSTIVDVATPYGVAVDPASGNLYITVDSAVMVATL